MNCSLNVHFLSRRQPPSEEDVICADAVTFDCARRRALIDGYIVHIPRAEAAVLDVLMRDAGTTVHRAKLIDALPPGCENPDALLDRLISRLRRRLTPTPLTAPRIHPGPSHGYLFGAAA